MLSGRNILCYSSSDFRTYHPTLLHHLVRRLARENRILFVESPFQRSPLFRAEGWRRLGRRLRTFLLGFTKVNEHLYLLSPPRLCLPPLPGRRAATRALLRRTVRKNGRRLHLEKPVAWIASPEGAPAAEALRQALVVYHAFDRPPDAPWHDGREIEAMEARLLRRADLVLAASQPLFERLSRLHGRCYFVPPAVDAEFFSPSRVRRFPLPPEISVIPRPRIGYVGSLDAARVDLDLLGEVARAEPNLAVVIVGPQGAGVDRRALRRLLALRNVHCLGPRPHEEIPHYLAGLQVALIPFRSGEATRYAVPLKFGEYLAAGKAVVSTELPALDEYADRPRLLRVARSRAEFVDKVREALAEDPLDGMEERLREARAQDWTDRLRKISGIVAEGGR